MMSFNMRFTVTIHLVIWYKVWVRYAVACSRADIPIIPSGRATLVLIVASVTVVRRKALLRLRARLEAVALVWVQLALAQ